MDKSEIDKKIKGVLAKIFNLEANKIGDDLSNEKVKRWDSLRHMNLVLALEQEFGVEFTDDEIPGMLNYKQIFKNIQEKVG